jgi:hypothetical protein
VNLKADLTIWKWMNKMYVDYEKSSGRIVLKLPEQCRDYERELYSELYNTEAITTQVLIEMDRFVIEWFKTRGVPL